MFILFRPVCGVEPVIIPDCRFSAWINKQLYNLGSSISRSDMQNWESLLVLDSRISPVSED